MNGPDLFLPLVKWLVILSIAIVAIGSIPMFIAERWGPVGLWTFLALLIAIPGYKLWRRMPRRKREI